MADDNDINVDRDWTFGINLTGVQAPTGANMEVPTGYYKGALSDLYINPERNASRVIIKVTMKGGPYEGVTRTSGLGVPTSPTDKVRYYWRALAESAGYGPAQLDKGEIKLNAKAFLGKEVFFFYQAKDENHQYDDMSFLPPAIWEARHEAFLAEQNEKANLGSNGVAPDLGSTTSASIETASSLGGGGNLGGGQAGTAKKDLLNELGM